LTKKKISVIIFHCIYCSINNF